MGPVDGDYPVPQLREVLYTRLGRVYSGVRRGMYLRTGAMRFIPGDRNLWIAARLSPVVRTE